MRNEVATLRRLADEWTNPDLYAIGVDEGWPNIDLYRLIVRGLQRNFHNGSDADRAALLIEAPPSDRYAMGRSTRSSG